MKKVKDYTTAGDAADKVVEELRKKMEKKSPWWVAKGE